MSTMTSAIEDFSRRLQAGQTEHPDDGPLGPSQATSGHARPLLQVSCFLWVRNVTRRIGRTLSPQIGPGVARIGTTLADPDLGVATGPRSIR